MNLFSNKNNTNEEQNFAEYIDEFVEHNLAIGEIFGGASFRFNGITSIVNNETAIASFTALGSKDRSFDFTVVVLGKERVADVIDFSGNIWKFRTEYLHPNSLTVSTQLIATPKRGLVSNRVE